MGLIEPSSGLPNRSKTDYKMSFLPLLSKEIQRNNRKEKQQRNKTKFNKQRTT